MRVSRLLSVILIIANKKNITGQQLADHFEVSIRTIYRDIEEICKAGIPIVAIDGRGGGYSIMEGYSLDKLFLSTPEVETLINLINGFETVMGKNEIFNDIVLKFRSKSKDKRIKKNTNMVIDMNRFGMDDRLKEYIFILSKAIENDRLISFDYSNRNYFFEKRVVEPIKIEFSNGEWFVIGFCRVRSALRKFKLIRIDNLQKGEKFERKEINDEELREYFKNSYKNSVKVKIKFKSIMQNRIQEYFSKDSIRKEGDDSYIVEEVFPMEEPLIKFIIGLGKECEVLEPFELRLLVQEYLKDIINKY